MEEFKFPDVGSGITEGEILKVHVKEGDIVKEDQVLFEIETAKAVVEMPSPAGGTILRINVKEGQTIKVGDVLAVIGKAGEIIEEKKEKPQQTQLAKRVEIQQSQVIAVQPAQQSSGRVVATPHTRQLAKHLGVEINKVRGTGNGDRITDEDVQNAVKSGIEKKQDAKKVESPRVKFERFGQVLRIPIHGVRKTIMERIQISVSVPTVTNTDEADITRLVKLREKEKKVAINKGIKLTYLPFIAKAVIIALREHPYVNSSIDEQENHIVLKKYYNIGIAVDTADGLIVPVMKNADKKSIFELAMDMEKLSEKARERTLTVEDMQGGSFTITNLGTFGGLFFTPILNHPESAILGIGKIIDRLKYDGKKLAVRKAMPLSLTYDHRVIDGALAARFLNTVIKHLEDTDLLLVDE